MAQTLQAIYNTIPQKKCKWCGGKLKSQLDYYDHSEGWSVEGFKEKQWLSLQCMKCDYEWSIWKLGYPRE